MAPREGKYFFIQSGTAGFVLDLEHGHDMPGTRVVLTEPKREEEINYTQLWYLDYFDNSIRNKQTEFCLDIKSGYIVVNPPNRASETQRWIYTNDTIQSREDFENIVAVDELTLGSPAMLKSAEGAETEFWTFNYRPPVYMYIRSQLNEKKVLDAKKDNLEPGTPVITWSDKGDMSDNQLWYETKHGVIASKQNGFVLDCADPRGKGTFVLNPYNVHTSSQQWVRHGNYMVNRETEDDVVETKKEPVFVGSKSGSLGQLWYFEEIEGSIHSMNHKGNGRTCLVRNRLSGHVMGVMKTQIVSGQPIEMVDTFNYDFNTQFYIDEVTGTLRLAQNDFSLEMEEDMKLRPYDPYSTAQQWEVKGRIIRHRHHTNEALMIDPMEPEENGTFPICGRVVKGEYTGDKQFQWQFIYIAARSCYLKNAHSGKMLDVKKDKASVGADVIMWEQKKNVEPNQLWYEDERGILRSKMNGYVIECEEKKSAKMGLYDPNNRSQAWIRIGNRIQNKYDTNLVLQVKGGFGSRLNLASITCERFKGSKEQSWEAIFVD